MSYERVKDHPLYHVWSGIKNRCYNRRDSHWVYYGGRGIKVCRRWRRSFAAFLRDMGPRPSSKHQLDRYPNNDGDYTPHNCRWATPKQQARNKRSNRNLKGRCATDWARDFSFHNSTIRHRLAKGMSPDRALSPHDLRAEGSNGTRLLTFAGRTQHLSKWAHDLGISHSTLHERLQNWSIKKALTTQKRKPNSGWTGYRGAA